MNRRALLALMAALPFAACLAPDGAGKHVDVFFTFGHDFSRHKKARAWRAIYRVNARLSASPQIGWPVTVRRVS